MKKKWAGMLGFCLLAAALTGCGEEQGKLSELKTDKYVTLGEYKGLEVTLASPKVTDAHLENYINYVLTNRAKLVEVTDRPCQEGDTVRIDYEGKIDGETFEGGAAQEFDLELGSGTFIPGFEEGLVGAEIGETRDLNINFPDPYTNSPDLSGMPVVFTVTVNKIQEKELPELDDALVQSLDVGCSTVAEYRDYVYDLLNDDATATYERNLEDSLVQQAMAACEFKEPPEWLVDEYYEGIVRQLNSYATMSNMDFNTFITQAQGLTMEAFEEQARMGAAQSARESVMLQAIANKEGVTVTEAEVQAAMEADAQKGGYDSVETFKEVVGDDNYEDYVMCDKVLKIMKDSAVIKEPEQQ